MKRDKKLVVPVIAVMAAGISIYIMNVTRRKQVQAKAENRHIPFGPYEAVLKRLLDAAASGLALVLLSPVMCLTALAVKIKLGSPVIFSQERPGLGGKVFRIFKFRTMREARDGNGEMLPDEARLTPFGKFLRSVSLDELPELVNILKGDMSLVGPRPLLPAYLPYYTEEEKHRHDVLPGLTGYAQAHGRNAVGWADRLAMDTAYVGRITFLGDMKIIFETVYKVLARDGITSPSSATMESFIRYAENRKQSVNQRHCPGLRD